MVVQSHLRVPLCPVPRKLTSRLHFPQPVHVAGLERSVLSVATVHPVPPATMSLGSATVHPASLGLAVSRVGAPPTPALWRGTTGGEFPRVRPGLTLADLSLACQPGTFGKDCEHLCRCPGETWACHPASGTCVCAAGYHGTDCQQRESGGQGFCPPFWYARWRGAALKVATVRGGGAACLIPPPACTADPLCPCRMPIWALWARL